MTVYLEIELIMTVYLNTSYLEEKTRLTLKLSRKEATSTHLSQDKEMVWYFVAWVAFTFCLHTWLLSGLLLSWFILVSSGLIWCWCSVNLFMIKKNTSPNCIRPAHCSSAADSIKPAPGVRGCFLLLFSFGAKWNFSFQEVFLENVLCSCSRISYLLILLQDELLNTSIWKLLYSSIWNSGQNTSATGAIIKY